MKPYVPVFSTVFDVAVIGSGYAGFAAARKLAVEGRRVLLVNGQPNVLWETTQAFAQTPLEGEGEWSAWHQRLTAARAGDDRSFHAGTVEIQATAELLRCGVEILYYCYPVAAELDECLESLVLATRGGLKRIAAEHWIDATEDAVVCRLIDPDLALKSPREVRHYAAYQCADWGHSTDDVMLAGRLRWLGGFEQERLLELGAESQPREGLLAGLKALHDAADMSGAVLSHCSRLDYPVYGDGKVGGLECLPRNLAPAVAGLQEAAIESLPERFALGIAAAGRATRATSTVDARIFERPLPELTQAEECSADVFVCGMGTGGAVAAIAAGREGADVLCNDLFKLPGGIGTGGGIHGYYYGACGGLQEEIDQRTLEFEQYFGATEQVRAFHPEAKRLALEMMMKEAGVRILPNSFLFDVTAQDGRIESARIASGDGVCVVRAAQWIDGSGDGDLCALAGASYRLGRQGDMRQHAYSQSVCYYNERDGRFFLNGNNMDAGWVDATDSVDLSYARINALCQYLKHQCLFVFPILGLRQGRQIDCDYHLSLSDILERRRFDDCIGYAGAWVDNHSRDLEFESDDQIFLVWCAHQHRLPSASELPYRMLLPQGLENCILASRAAGVTMDAHHSCRMERDMQRIGEAAGYTAAIAVGQKTSIREVAYADVRRRLEATGALDESRIRLEPKFGCWLAADSFTKAVRTSDVETGLAKVADGRHGEEMWALLRSHKSVETRLEEMLRRDNAQASWLAACVLAARGNPSAEPRLLEALRNREYGCEDVDTSLKPEVSPVFRPNWEVAIALLRVCGTAACVKPLLDYAAHEGIRFRVRASLLLTFERLVQRNVISDYSTIEQTVSHLLTGIPEPSYQIPGQIYLRELQEKMPDQEILVPEKRDWQLYLVAARIRRAFELSALPETATCVTDERGYVRKAFNDVLN